MIPSKDIAEARALLGAHIRHARKGQQLTQQQLSRITGVHASVISKIECGRCNATFDTIVLLANGLGVELAHLFRDVGAPNRPEGTQLPVGLSCRGRIG